MKAKASALIPFVPSGPDFEKALGFFADLGFATAWRHSDIAGLRFGGAYFMLQSINVPTWQENQMHVIEVEDLDLFWSEIDALDLPTRYQGVRTKRPTDFPWGREVHIIDPAGVCWHFRTAGQAAREAMRPALVPEFHCSDLDRSLSFYVDLLGFRILYDRPEERFAFLDRNGAELMLEEYAPGARMLAKAPFERPYGRGINFQIRVEDVDGLQAKLVGAGLPIFLPLEERWYRRDNMELGTRQFIVQDPDGYLLRLQTDIGTRKVGD